MTPAINLAKKNKIKHTVHSYLHDRHRESYGQEAAEKMNVSADQVFKTLVVSIESKELIVAVIPVSAQLSMKQLSKVAAAKKAKMADKYDVERSTGYVLGGVSPLGQKKRLRTFIDISAEDFDTIFVSAGQRGLEIELTPNDLKELLNAQYSLLIVSNL